MRIVKSSEIIIGVIGSIMLKLSSIYNIYVCVYMQCNLSKSVSSFHVAGTNRSAMIKGGVASLQECPSRPTISVLTGIAGA